MALSQICTFTLWESENEVRFGLENVKQKPL